MVLANYQGQYQPPTGPAFTPAPLIFGAGTNYQLLGIDGIRELAVRQGDVSKARQDGSWAGLNYMDERVFTVKLMVFAPTIPFETAVANIAAAFQNIQDGGVQGRLDLQLPNWATQRFVMCRPTKASDPINTDFVFNKTEIDIELVANDPVVYDSVAATRTVGLPSPTAGLTFPVTFNATFGASAGGSMLLPNLGNYKTAPVFTVQGPMTNPKIQNLDTGEVFALSISLGVSDSLVIDMGARTVILNGTASRFNTVQTGYSWFTIGPQAAGYNGSISVGSSDAAPVAGTFTGTLRNAWGFM